MRLSDLLAHLREFQLVVGSPHAAEVSRVEVLREADQPFPGTVYLCQDVGLLTRWLLAHRRSHLARHLVFILPSGAAFSFPLALRSDIAVMLHEAEVLPLDLSARILRLFYQEQPPFALDSEQVRQEILQEVFQGNHSSWETLLARAKAVGLDLAHKRQVMLIEPDSPEALFVTQVAKGEGYLQRLRIQLQTLVRGVLLKDSPQHMVVAYGSGAVALLDERAQGQAAGLAEQIAEALPKQIKEPGFVIALGEPCASPENLPQSFHQAQIALEVRRLYGVRSNWLSYDRVRMLVFLHRLNHNPELTEVVEAVLQPISDIETGYRRALLEALAAYLEHSRSIQQASKALGIHPNTLKYRLKRLEDLLGLREVDDERNILYYIAARLALLKLRLSS